jgi:hypothetical protein
VLNQWLGDTNLLDFSGFSAMDYAGVGFVRASGTGETGCLILCGVNVFLRVPIWSWFVIRLGGN